MSATAAATQLEANHERNIVEIVGRLNTGTLSVSDGEHYVTLLLAEIDAHKRTLNYVNCGHNPALLFRSETGRVTQLDSSCAPIGISAEVTIGLHWKGDLPAAFEYDTNLTDRQDPWLVFHCRVAGHASVGKTFRKVAAAPHVFLEGNYASGTKSPKGHGWNTFDQIYPSNHDKLGFADLVGRKNLMQFRVGVKEEPTKKWKLKQQFESYRLATSNDNFYPRSGAIAVAAHPGASRHIGNEFDVVAEYEVNKGLNFGFGYARMFAGQFLETTTRGHDYSYPYAYFEYNFSKSGFHFPITPNKRN